MELFEITNWLKDSILGIIILGASGSALCIVTIKLFVKWLPGGFRIYKTKRGERNYYLGSTIGFFHETDHTTGTIYMIIYQAVSLLTKLLIGSVFLLLFFILFFQGGSILSIGSYLSLMLSIVFLFFTAQEFMELRDCVMAMRNIADKGIEEQDKKAKNV